MFGGFTDEDGNVGGQGLYVGTYRNYLNDYSIWPSPDKLGGDITDPQSLNRYAYVMNNPTTLNDPLGLQAGYLDPCGDPVYSDSNAQCPGGWDWSLDAGLFDYYGYAGFYNSGGGSGPGTGSLQAPISAGPAGQSPPAVGNALTASVQGEININLLNFFNLNLAFGFAIDTKGCVAAVHTKGGLVGSGTRASIGLSVSGSSAETVYDLGGPFSQTTGTVGEALSGEGSFFFGKSPHGRVVGGSLGATANTPTHLPATVASGATRAQVTPVAVVPIPGASCAK